MKRPFHRSQDERMAIAEALVEALGEAEENKRHELIQEAKKQLMFEEKKAA